jgi:hypothetical protein
MTNALGYSPLSQIAISYVEEVVWCSRQAQIQTWFAASDFLEKNAQTHNLF